MEKPQLLRAFFSFGMWHIWNAFNEGSNGFYKTAKNRPEMMKMLYANGYRLVTTDNHFFYFELK